MVVKANEYLENLELVLTSPRKRAPGTLRSYLSTARGFLNWLGEGKIPPTDKDLRRFFMEREKAGILTNTRSVQFVQLKKLFVANDWRWPFTKDDQPISEDTPTAPAFTEAEVRQLIASRSKFSKAENFYLAISITYGRRCEEMSRINARDVKDGIITFEIAKQKKAVIKKQLIPETIRPYIDNYKIKRHSPRALNHMFHRIASKAGLELEHRAGWHSMRRSLFTLLMTNLAASRYPPLWAAEYLAWSKRTIGLVFMGTAMAGVYTHPEVLANDPYQVDRVCQREDIHPFLKAYLSTEEQEAFADAQKDIDTELEEDRADS